jgi:phosphopantothenoylcysteine decarboxylase
MPRNPARALLTLRATRCRFTCSTQTNVRMSSSSDAPSAAAALPQQQTAARRRPRVLLGLSGSVACVKAPALVAALSAFADVRVVATPAALRFLPPADGDAAQQQPARLAGAPLSTDVAEWAAWRAVGDSVHHIALRRWADALLVAPLSANSLAKLANGLCDNLLTCVVRAWDFRKPLAVAPAMNTAMWDSPFTARVRILRALCCACLAC